MSVPQTRPQQIVSASSAERMTTGMPDVERALSELDSHRGELFCTFSFTGINIGYVPEEGPVMTFEESKFGSDATLGNVIVHHDANSYLPLVNSGRIGGVPSDSGKVRDLTDPIRLYVGTLSDDDHSAHALPNGPTAVETSASPIEAQRSPVYQDALVIGTAAVCAFAFGKAIKELGTAPDNFDLSLGLFIAAQTKALGITWQTKGVIAGKPAEEVFDELKAEYVDRAMVPAALNALKLTVGWPVSTTSIGNRLPLYGFSFDEARALLVPKINMAIDGDDEAKRRLEQRKNRHGAYGDFDTYLSSEFDNFLRNRLGLK